MRLLIVGPLEGQLTEATKLAMEGGAKVAHLKGAFDAEGVRSCIEAARTGRVGAAGVAGDLAADGRVDAWDGSDDAPGEGGGDEFSLADLGLA